MKKFFQFFSIIAMAIAAVSFASCDKDDDKGNDENEVDVPVRQLYAQYAACINEEFLKYGEMTVTFEANNETKTYKMSEAPTSTLDLVSYIGVEMTVPVRKLVIPVFEVTMKPVKATVKIELSEAGKQACAEASEEEDMPFVMMHMLGRCDAEGNFTESEDAICAKKISSGVYVRMLPEFIDMIAKGDLVSKEL